MQTTKTHSRNSNIELLRIIAMFGVIILHYNNAQIGGAFKYASAIKTNSYILYILECVFISAVNVFLLISGYYMCSVKKIALTKPCQLIVQVICFRVASYIIFVLMDEIPYSNQNLKVNFLPVNYFVILYATLYILIPFINFLINQISIKSFTRLIIILLMVFSIWPTIVDCLIPILNNSLSGLSTISMYGSQYGYTIVNFILMYLLGAYISKLNINSYTNIKQRFTYISHLILCWIILFIWVQYHLTIHKSTDVIFAYCNPLVITSAILTFILFIKFKPRNSKLINTVAKGSFTVFLSHTYFFDLLNIQNVATKHPFILVSHIILSCTFIYILCWLLSLIYNIIEKLFFSQIYKKLNSIEITCE